MNDMMSLSAFIDVSLISTVFYLIPNRIPVRMDSI
jgi:hypothetical protein